MRIPLIIGHRGASAVAPENTLAAFRRAVSDGADGVEFDVRLSQDEVPVVIHDRDLRRTGLMNVKVSELSSRELSEIDVGRWFDLKRGSEGQNRYEGETVPTLEDVFRLFAQSAQTLYVELKCDKRDAGKLASEAARIARTYDFGDRVVVESFALEAIAEVKRLAPQTKTAALFERSLSRPAPSAETMIEEAIACRADEIALHHTLAGKRVLAAARERGLRVVVWTVDEPRWIKRAVVLGVHTLITNDPAAMREALNRFQAE